MTVSYNPLWKLLIDRGWKKKDLQEKASISPSTIAKLGRDEDVTTAVLARICSALDCQISDICTIEHEEECNDAQQS